MRQGFILTIGMTAVAACLSATLAAQTTDSADPTTAPVNPILIEADRTLANPDVSPALRIERRRSVLPELPALDEEFRSIDGSGNNPDDADMGRAGTALLRLMPAAYGDGVQTMAGTGRPAPRQISSIVHAQRGSVLNLLDASDFLWQWGQFLDHDLDLTDGANPPENADIAVPAGDRWFDPQNTGTASIAFNRSLYDHASGSGPDNPRQQVNEISAWIDASNVYGSDRERAEALRAFDGLGHLRTSAGNLLPFNVDGLPNAGGDSPELFLAGDVRANEQVGLTALHTLFVREHNRLADRIAAADPQLSGDEIYERARRIVGAEIQVITYREYLPALLGPDALAPYRGYRADIDASISNIFSTASYRYGHSGLSPTLLRLNRGGRAIGAGHLALRDAFFAPQRIIDEGGIEPLLRGLAAQVHQAIDVFIVDDVRNFLFGPPAAGGFDLAALNIQRGRDHGLPAYNDVRRSLGLRPARGFRDISSSREVRDRLRAAYASVEDVDVWVGGLAEDPLPGALVGQLISQVLINQFEALRDGDRYWYRLVFSPDEIRRLENTRLSDIIRRNTTIGRELADDVFHVRRTSR